MLLIHSNDISSTKSFYQIIKDKTFMILASGNRKEALGKVDLKGKDIEEDIIV